MVLGRRTAVRGVTGTSTVIHTVVHMNISDTEPLDEKILDNSWPHLLYDGGVNISRHVF